MKYKLRKVVARYIGPGKVLKDVKIPWELLECGHSVRFINPRSKAEFLRLAFDYRRQCRDCATPTGGSSGTQKG